jgi:hypothetical protein
MPNIATLRTRYDYYRHRVYGCSGVLVALVREALAAFYGTADFHGNPSGFRTFLRLGQGAYDQRLVHLLAQHNTQRDLIRATRSIAMLSGFIGTDTTLVSPPNREETTVLLSLWNALVRWCCEDQRFVEEVTKEKGFSACALLVPKLDAFLSENVQITDFSACPTTVKGAEYRMDCLFHKFFTYTTAISHSIIRKLDCVAFVEYVRTVRTESPLANLLLLIGTVYAQQLDIPTIKPYRDGKDLERLYAYIAPRLVPEDDLVQIQVVLRQFRVYTVQET